MGSLLNVGLADLDAVYTDGGVIGSNPSLIGGTWAFCYVKNDLFVDARSGSVTPEVIGLAHVSNNFTELLAIIEALENLPAGWEGSLFTDSEGSLRRAKKPGKGKEKGSSGYVPGRVREAQ